MKEIDWYQNIINFTFLINRNRFKEISQCITFDDINTRDERKVTDKKFHKIRAIFDIFRQKLRSAYTPGLHLCIEETLYSFRGRCSHRQYMPKKPAKYGLKFNNIVCCKSAYLLDTIPYLGKSNEEDPNAKNLGQKLVESLSEFYNGSKRCVTMDNFFTSIPMAKKLYSNDLSIIGTLRQNKSEIPQSFLSDKSKVLHSSQFAYDSYMTLVSYTPKVKRLIFLTINYK